jgi:hypothetical protein
MTAPTNTTVELVDCPDCDGYGSTGIRLAGRRMVEPVAETPCNGCSGTGLTAADQVAVCEVCRVRFWGADACVHDDRVMCPGCAKCADCADGARSEAAYDVLREASTIGRPS